MNVSRYVVEVNEAKVYATTAGSSWWSMFLLRFRNTARICESVVSIGGALCEVACDSRDDAEWLAASMVLDHGLPKSAVRVLQLNASKEQT